jgi:Tfp pilus assembly pilus retraction ATPase PilT
MNMDDLLRIVVERGASDLHLKVGSPPVLRINGKLVRYGEPLGLTPKEIEEAFEHVTTKGQREGFARKREDLSDGQCHPDRRTIRHADPQSGVEGPPSEGIDHPARCISQIGQPR